MEGSTSLNAENLLKQIDSLIRKAEEELKQAQQDRTVVRKEKSEGELQIERRLADLRARREEVAAGKF